MTRQGSRLDAQRRRAHRRPGFFPRRRFALALVLAVQLLGCSAAAAALNPSLGVQATIHQRNGATVPDSGSLAALQANPAQCPKYPGPYHIDLHGPGGGFLSTDNIGTSDVWSLATVLGCLSTPVSPSAVNGVTVVQSNGLPELSQYSQLGPGTLSSAVIYTDGTNIVYDRPWGGGTDNNAADQVREQSPLVIDVYEGALIPVTASASQTTVPAGTTVSFSATAPAAVSYSWNFEGGAQGAQTSSLPTPSVTFGTPGKYNVGLQVSDSSGGGGGAEVLITVTGGAPPTTPASTTTPTTGPTSGSGNTPGAPSSHHNRGTGRGGHGPGTGSGGSGAPATAGPASGGTSTGSGAPGSGSSSAGSVTASRHGKSARGRRSHTAPAKRRSTSVTGPSTVVTGRLIGAVTPLAAGASPLVHTVSGPGSAPAMRRPISASILPAIAGVLGVLLLFSLGAGRELRWGHGLRVLLFG